MKATYPGHRYVEHKPLVNDRSQRPLKPIKSWHLANDECFRACVSLITRAMKALKAPSMSFDALITKTSQKDDSLPHRPVSPEEISERPSSLLHRSEAVLRRWSPSRVTGSIWGLGGVVETGSQLEELTWITMRNNSRLPRGVFGLSSDRVVISGLAATFRRRIGWILITFTPARAAFGVRAGLVLTSWIFAQNVQVFCRGFIDLVSRVLYRTSFAVRVRIYLVTG